MKNTQFSIGFSISHKSRVHILELVEGNKTITFRDIEYIGKMLKSRLFIPQSKIGTMGNKRTKWYNG
jgi:hypothetical protein